MLNHWYDWSWKKIRCEIGYQTQICHSPCGCLAAKPTSRYTDRDLHLSKLPHPGKDTFPSFTWTSTGNSNLVEGHEVPSWMILLSTKPLVISSTSARSAHADQTGQMGSRTDIKLQLMPHPSIQVQLSASKEVPSLFLL